MVKTLHFEGQQRYAFPVRIFYLNVEIAMRQEDAMPIDKPFVEKLVLEFILNYVKDMRKTEPALFKRRRVIAVLKDRISEGELIPLKELPTVWKSVLRRLVMEVLWDLIIQRVIDVGLNGGEPNLNVFTVTAYGETVLTQPQPSHYDPKGYIDLIQSFSRDVDKTIIEYVEEGLACMRTGTVFAAAVMFGAAAEKAVLLFIEALANATKDPQKKKLQNLLNGQGGVPKRYEAIEQACRDAIDRKLIPNNVHQGSIGRVMCMFDMIRVQRNDAVHPKTGTCSRENVLLTIQSLPNALRVTYSMIDWLQTNSI